MNTAAGGRRPAAGLGRSRRRVLVKARVVRQQTRRFGAAPLAVHLSYLSRGGVTRVGARAAIFDAAGDEADGRGFAERCEGDRHHFRFILGPDGGRAELVNYRVRGHHMIADRLFAAAELRLGSGDCQSIVRATRTDGRPA